MLKFKRKLEPSDYNLTVNSSGGGHVLSFTNDAVFNEIVELSEQSDYPIFVFQNDSVNYSVKDYVIYKTQKSVQFIGYVSSAAWTNGMVDKSIPLYIVV